MLSQYSPVCMHSPYLFIFPGGRGWGIALIYRWAGHCNLRSTDKILLLQNISEPHIVSESTPFSIFLRAMALHGAHDEGRQHFTKRQCTPWLNMQLPAGFYFWSDE